MTPSRFLALALVCAGPHFLSSPASAHPHGFIDTSVEVIFDAEGRFSAVHEVWTIDYDTTDIMESMLDLDRNGRVDDTEMASATIESPALSWIEQGDYFTRITLAGQRIQHGEPTEFAARLQGGRIVVEFVLPLIEPQSVTLGAGVDVFDADFYYEFSFSARPFTLAGAPESCGATRRVDANIDPRAVMLIRRLGLAADPAVLNDPATGYTVRVAIDCAA